MKANRLVKLLGLFFVLALVAPVIPLAQVEAATDVPCNAAALVNAVQDAVSAGGRQTLKLAKDCNYVLTEPAFAEGKGNASGLPKINKVKLTIKGNGATIKRKANAPSFRIMMIAKDGEVTLNNLTLRGGKTVATKTGGGVGGAIYLEQGKLILKQVTVADNATGRGVNTSVTGGTAGYGGGIANYQGELTVLNSQITNNRAGDGGNSSAQVGGAAGAGGGIFSYYGVLTVDASTIDGNRAGNGGNGVSGAGGGIGGGIFATNLKITNSTVSNNRAGNGGNGTNNCAGPGGSGGGIYTSVAEITNTTISGNQAGDGGTDNNTTFLCGGIAGYNSSGGGVYTSVTAKDGAAAGHVFITNSTLTNNRAGHKLVSPKTDDTDGKGGNLYVIAAYDYQVRLRNTVIGASEFGASCAGFGTGNLPTIIINVANNLDTGTSCAFGSANGSKSNASANLGALQDNGGETFTHALQNGSAALEAGSDSICAAAVGEPNYGAGGKDQRGRPRPQNSHCDIGAYEQDAPPTPTPTLTPTNTPTPTPTPTQPTSGTCAGPANGRISCWKGENNANDSVGSNNGSAQGGATYASGKVGQAFNFNGNNQYVRINDNVSLRPQQVSVDAWVFPRTVGDIPDALGPVIFNKDRGSVQGAPVSFALFGPGTTGKFTAGLSFTDSTDAVLVSTNSFALNQWYNVAMTWDGSTLRLYVNGALEGSKAVGAKTIIYSSDAAAIGRHSHVDRSFDGLIDQVQVWNRALTAQEIISLNPTGECAGPSNGRVSCWKGENNALDSVGTNYGTLQGGATFAPGKVGQAFSFNGTSGHVLVPDSASLDVTTQFTLSAWINPGSLMDAPPFPGKGGIISKIGGSGGNNGYQYGLAKNNTGLWCQFNAEGEFWPQNQLQADVTGLVPLNTWTHVACTYDHSKLTAYVNGNPVGSKVIGAKTTVNSSSNLRISSDDNTNVYFDGLIDEAQVWNRALTAQEIKDVYLGSGGGSGCTTAPDKPKPVKPIDNAVVDGPRVVLDWGDAPCADWYNVVVRTGSKAGAPADQKTQLDKTKYKTQLLTPGHTYWWQVEACNAVGCTKSAGEKFFLSP